MKKIVLLAASVFVLTACGSPTAQDTVSGDLGVDVSSAEVLSQTDDHGGFHGDGMTVIVLDCGDTDIAGQIGGMEGWKPFPLDDTVKALVYGVEDGTAKMGPYLSDEAGEPLVPEIEEGYYRLIDRQAEEGKATGADILHRASFNFTLGLYDAGEDRLYFCKLDT